jgi:hypothetical protein
MRLSLMKGAHADLSSTAWQETGVKPHFASPRLLSLGEAATLLIFSAKVIEF